MTTFETATWLLDFYSHLSIDAEIPGDDLGTTFGLCGAVLLASALSGTRSPPGTAPPRQLADHSRNLRPGRCQNEAERALSNVSGIFIVPPLEKAS